MPGKIFPYIIPMFCFLSDHNFGGGDKMKWCAKMYFSVLSSTFLVVLSTKSNVAGYILNAPCNDDKYQGYWVFLKHHLLPNYTYCQLHVLHVLHKDWGKINETPHKRRPKSIQREIFKYNKSSLSSLHFLSNPSKAELWITGRDKVFIFQALIVIFWI